MSDARHELGPDSGVGTDHPAVGVDYAIVAVGELLWDILPSGRRLGGAPANFAYHARRLGMRASLVSRVGADDLGAESLALLREHGVDVVHVTADAEHPTGTVSVTLRDGGEPEYTINEDVAWDFIGCAPASMELTAMADALCFGTLAQRSVASRRTILRLLDVAPPGCLRLLDVNLRQDFYDADILRDALERAGVLKANEAELRTIGALLEIPGDDATLPRNVADAFSLTAVAVTRGARGALLRVFEDEVEHPGFANQTASAASDTVGAGDAFAAALCTGLLRGRSPESIVENANRLAAFVCSRMGAMPPMPDGLIEELKATPSATTPRPVTPGPETE